MTEMFEAVRDLITKKEDNCEVIVVAGGGQWALEYAKALHWFMVQKMVKVVFVYRSAYGLDQLQYYHRYLKNTLVNMIEAERLGALCIDLSRLTDEEQRELPQVTQPKAVFVVTPPETHCENAIKWVGETDYIFIEKPFDANPAAINSLKEKLTWSKTTVYGFDHYAARLWPFLTEQKLKGLGFGECKKFTFDMFEAAPRGLIERAPSINDSGMLFDMASHALPILSWLAEDLTEVGQFDQLYASTLLSPANRRYINSETFGRLSFSFKPKSGVGNSSVSAEVRVGKGVGATDSKVVILTNYSGKEFRLDQGFMLARYLEEEEAIHEKVIHRLVAHVISGSGPKESDGVFGIDLGADIVNVLISWTQQIKDHLEGRNLLPTYHQGMTCEQICQVNEEGNHPYAYSVKGRRT